MCLSMYIKLSCDSHSIKANMDQLNRHESILRITSWNLPTRAVSAFRTVTIRKITQLHRTAHSAQDAHAAQSNTPAQNCPAIKITLHLQPFASNPPKQLSTRPNGQVLFPICSAQLQWAAELDRWRFVCQWHTVPGCCQALVAFWSPHPATPNNMSFMLPTWRTLQRGSTGMH